MSFQYDENNRVHRLIRTIAVLAVSLVAFVLIWWFVTYMADMKAFPTPDKVFDALIDLIRDGDTINHHTLGEYIYSSFTTFLKGFAIAFAVSVPLGLLLGYVRPMREITAPWIEIIRPIAPIAWAPIFIISFGLELGPALVVAVGIFFPMLTSIIFGVQRIDSNWIEASKTLGASQPQIFVKIVLPATVPYILNGMKVGLGVGWMCIVAAELYAKQLGGIGHYLLMMTDNGLWANAFAAIIVIAFLGLITTGLAEYFSKVVSRRMGMDA
ncbi:ABC-type nitrate/sulfonate/bicarbonate transport system, permease component [Thermoplasmatales archaeon BRNA1]|nr:ABC-type nitrate/sulfonate/bicarbonate transport system, permease component [Thermoplasmatales archaeon BRNA1]